MHLRRVLLPACCLLLAVAGPGLAQQPGAAPAGCPGTAELFPGTSARTVADSLFSLARVRGSRERYQLVAYTRPPRLIPGDNGGRPMLDSPDMDRLMHGGLRATVATLIDAQGRPVRVEVVHSSGDAQFDQFALGTTRDERFRPALAGSCPVPFCQVGEFEARAERSVRIGSR
jgi:TonB family protein